MTNDPATVTKAIDNISNGLLPGQVPGLALINASVAAAAAVVDFGKSVAASNPTFDTVKDGVVTHAELNGAIVTLTAARDLASKGGVALNPAQTTDQLIGAVAGAKAALDTATAAVTATPAAKAAVAKYDAAVAAKVSDADVTANNAVKASAISGLDTTFGSGNALWTALDGKIATDGAITNATSLFTALTNTLLSGADRALLVSEVTAKAGAYGVSLVASADKSLAIDKAIAAVDTAKTALISATDSTKANGYIDAVAANKTATDTLTKTQAADTAVAAAKAIEVKYTAAEKLASDTLGAVTGFDPAKAMLKDISGTAAAATVDGTDSKADVFYFQNKVTAADFTIGGASNFGAGDAIVLGSGYTFNSGAVATGNNSNLEFFFVKTATGTNIVIENLALGSASATVDAATGAVGTVAGQTDNVSVISLTGVSVDHLAVNNGVISYV